PARVTGRRVCGFRSRSPLPLVAPSRSTKKRAIRISCDHPMAKPLVTHVLWTLGRGGAERMVLDLAKHLPDAGFDVEVLAAGGGGDMLADFEAADIRVNVNKDLDSRMGAVTFLREAIRRRRPAIWHTHLTPVWAGVAAKTSFVSPWITTAHGFEPGLSFSARLA